MADITEVVDVNDPDKGIVSIIKAHVEVGEYLNDIDRNAYARGRADERRDVIAWLRKGKAYQGAILNWNDPEVVKVLGDHKAESDAWYLCLEKSAEAIHRRDHLKKSSES